MVSSYFTESALRQSTDALPLVLLTITHDSGVVRICNDSVTVNSKGNTFLPFPFWINLPQYRDKQSVYAQLSVTNVSRELVDEMRLQTTPMKVKIQLTTAAAPSTIDIEWDDFTWDQVTYNKSYISGRLSLENFLQEPYPSRLMASSGFPALFWQ